MLPGQHAFSHQHYPPDWASHPSHTPHHVTHTHTPSLGGGANNFSQFRGPAGLDHNAGLDRGAQSSALTGGGVGMGAGGGGGAAGQEGGAMNEENRRVLEWIAQMMRSETRESALLELSKKREQVPELALILWHSFGMSSGRLGCLGIIGRYKRLQLHRCHDFSASGDHLGLPAAQS